MNPSTRRPLTALALALSLALTLGLAVVPAPGLAGEEPPPNRAAFAIDLTDAPDGTLAESLRRDLGALLAAAQYTRGPGEAAASAPRITSVAQIIEQLRRHPGVAYVVLAQRNPGSADDSAVKLGQVFVVPDLIKISIRGDAAAPAAGGEPEASIVPGRPGEPPLIKFQFDPGQYGEPRP